jgi:diketogulonate reductase-like aldo/keto reductase
MRAQGKCKSLGVSNYTVAHLEELMRNSNVAPAVNQIEFSPFLYQRHLLEFCRAHRIQVEAYCPLTRGRKFRDSTLAMIARKHAKTPAQILLRWALQHDVVVIPKSRRRDRIEENAKLFDFALDVEDMSALDRLDEGFRVCWNPSTVS